MINNQTISCTCMENDKIIEEFHRMWDAFPGMARLINRKHEILAANEPARKSGFCEGENCAKVGAPESHKGCRIGKMFQSGEAQTQLVGGEKIKGWVPVAGYPDLCIHFTVMIPKEQG